jgi:hypothetical protein
MFTKNNSLRYGTVTLRSECATYARWMQVDLNNLMLEFNLKGFHTGSLCAPKSGPFFASEH